MKNLFYAFALTLTAGPALAEEGFRYDEVTQDILRDDISTKESKKVGHPIRYGRAEYQVLKYVRTCDDQGKCRNSVGVICENKNHKLPVFLFELRDRVLCPKYERVYCPVSLGTFPDASFEINLSAMISKAPNYTDTKHFTESFTLRDGPDPKKAKVLQTAHDHASTYDTQLSHLQFSGKAMHVKTAPNQETTIRTWVRFFDVSIPMSEP